MRAVLRGPDGMGCRRCSATTHQHHHSPWQLRLVPDPACCPALSQERKPSAEAPKPDAEAEQAAAAESAEEQAEEQQEGGEDDGFETVKAHKKTKAPAAGEPAAAAPKPERGPAAPKEAGRGGRGPGGRGERDGGRDGGREGGREGGRDGGRSGRGYGGFSKGRGDAPKAEPKGERW